MISASLLRTVLAALALAAAACGAAEAQERAGAPVLVDGFEDVSGWSARPADGVELTVRSDTGLHGRCLRLDFRFVKGGGYAVVHRDLALDLPEDYRFRFALRGQCLPQNLEFKLVDASGENVWWSNRRDFRFPAAWDSVTLKKRHIGFAWGPQGGGEIRHVAALEFAVTAGSGGSGTVWIDDLTLEALPPPGTAPPPVRASAEHWRSGHAAELAVDGDARTSWWSGSGDDLPALALDLQGPREFGGVSIDWVPARRALDYAVEASDDSATWRTLREVRGGGRERDDLFLPESEARFLRIRILSEVGRHGCAIREVKLESLEWGATLESFYRAIAQAAPRGSYPRGIRGEQAWWTVVGLDGDRQEALLAADGALETGRGAYSVEPFLFVDGRLVTWAQAAPRQSLEEGRLPVPSVLWSAGDLTLTITAFATGQPGTSTIIARYRVQNLAAGPRRVMLYLALRPSQVNPPAQFLGTPGGVAPLRTLVLDGRVVRTDGDRGIVSLTAPAGFGAATFDEGDVVANFLRDGRLPGRTQVIDPFGHASGALEYRLDLDPLAEEEVDIAVPLQERPLAPPERTDAAARAEVEAAFAAACAGWKERAGRVGIELPASAGPVVETLEAQLGWILVNRAGPAIQPGARSYARSWIRDGSLTSAALLRLGQPDVVREFLEWFAPFQYADGKVPCCVDQRGSDPVPEHDSSGEFIYLVAEHLRYTGDRDLAARLWPAVARAAAYLDSLRQTRRTAEWRVGGRQEFFGLLPPSISHEGYSAKPMHSYWDDLFALRGFKDAAWLAGVLGHDAERARLEAVRDEFQRELAASLLAAIARHRIDYVPGCADLGDFDATSTTIALNPVQAERALPRAALERTFEKYWEFFRDRRDGRQSWEAWTPYEMRNIGAFVRLGWRERADSLLQYFMRYRRPPGWNQWAEVVWHDERTPHFIGDLPHTWVGSDFVRSVLDMLAYEREADSALVVAAGVPARWLEGPGVSVRGLATRWGPVSYSARAEEGVVTARLEAGPRVPPGGVVVMLPGAFRTVSVNGAPATPGPAGEVVLRELPATVVLSP